MTADDQTDEYNEIDLDGDAQGYVDESAFVDESNDFVSVGENDDVFTEDVIEEDTPAEDPKEGDDAGVDTAAEEEELSPLEDAFSDFESEDEPEPEKSPDLANFIEELGIEGVSNRNELRSHIDSLKASMQVKEVSDPDLSAHIESVKKIHANGGDWKAYLSKNDEVKELEEQISLYESDMSYYSSMLLSQDEDQLSDFVFRAEKAEFERSLSNLRQEDKNKLAPQIKQRLNALKDELEGLGLSELSAKARGIASRYIDMTRGAVTKANEQLTSKKAEISSAASKAETDFKETKAKLVADISGYKSSVSSKFTPLVKAEAMSLFNSEPTNVTLPSGLVKLFLGEDGKISASKVAAVIERSKYGQKQLEYLAAKKQINNFRSSRNPSKKTGGGSAIGSSQKGAGGNGGEYDSYI